MVAAEPLGKDPPSGQPVAGADFLPEEWLALLVSPPRESGPRLAPDAAVADPAASLRAKQPLTRSQLLAAVGDTSPLLRRLAWLQFAAQPYGKHIFSFTAANVSLLVPLWATMWLFPDPGAFGTVQLAVGTAAVAALWLAALMTMLLNAGFSERFSNAIGRTGGLASPPKAARAEPEVSNHAFAVFVRYLELRQARGTSAGRSIEDGVAEGPWTGSCVLLEHDPADDMCSCASASCAGKLPTQAGYWRLAWVVVLCLLNYTFFLFLAFTPLVTLRSSVWTTAWSATIAAVYCAFNLEAYFFMANVRLSANVGALSLSSRLSRRAIAAALRSLLSRLHSAVDPGTESPPPPPAGFSDELYVRLHSLLVHVWRSRIPSLTSGSAVLGLYLGGSTICAVANIAAGSCIPAYAVVWFALCIFNVSSDIVHFSVANAGIDDARKLYLAARTDLRKLLARVPSPLDPQRAAWYAKVLDHDRLLSAFAEVDDYRSRFLGFAVTYGGARTLVVTGLTVCVGLYTILRGVGVRIVGDVVCPTF